MSDPDDWGNLASYAKKQWSQCGEEGVLERIFELIGTINQIAIEFGCSDGYSLSNTRSLVEKGWTVHMWDARPRAEKCALSDEKFGVPPEKRIPLQEHLILPENINLIFEHYQIPRRPDLLSIDIDGNDYWVWKALTYRPRVVVIEFNGALPPEAKCTVPYDPDFRHDGTDYYGASFALLCQLGREKGYAPVCQLMGLNIFFVLAELIPAGHMPDVHYTRHQSLPCDPKGRPWQHID